MHGDFNDAFDKIDAACGGMPKIATGTYMGTAQSGASHPNSLTFPFEPKLLIVTFYGRNTDQMVYIPGMEYAFTNVANPNDNQVCISQTGNTVTWYAVNGTTPSNTQLNGSNSLYCWFALG